MHPGVGILSGCDPDVIRRNGSAMSILDREHGHEQRKIAAYHRASVVACSAFTNEQPLKLTAEISESPDRGVEEWLRGESEKQRALRRT